MNFRATLAVAAVFLAAFATTSAQSTPLPQSTTQSQGAALGASDVAPAPPSKKVWTNDDLNDRHDSPAATPVRAVSKPALQPAPRAKTADAKWYRSQIAKLQAQVSALDPKIAALQSAIDGKQIDEPRKYGWVQPGNWPDQLAQLQTKRAGLLDQISTLEDEARHRGLSALDLP